MSGIILFGKCLQRASRDTYNANIDSRMLPFCTNAYLDGLRSKRRRRATKAVAPFDDAQGRFVGRACYRRGRRRAAMTACPPPGLLDHASTSALTTGVTTKHVNRLPSSAERTTSSLFRGFHASNCPIGLSGATIVGPAQGRACGVEQETSPRPHLQKIENSRQRGVLPLQCCTNVYDQPLHSGDSAVRYMTQCTLL